MSFRVCLLAAALCGVSPSIAVARVQSANEAATAKLLSQIVQGTLVNAELVNVTVILQGDFVRLQGSEMILASFKGCVATGVSERGKPYIVSEGRSNLSGKALRIVDAVLDCSQSDNDPHFARVGAMYDVGKLEMLVFRKGLG